MTSKDRTRAEWLAARDEDLRNCPPAKAQLTATPTKAEQEIKWMRFLDAMCGTGIIQKLK